MTKELPTPLVNLERNWCKIGLRPIVLLNGVRKIPSTTTLARIFSEVVDYLPSSQSAYRRGRATTDVVFTLRILSSISETKRWSLYRLGINLSKAFDTPHRSDLLSTIVSVAPTTPDVLPLVHTLLSDTTLQVRVQGKTAPPFRSNVGTPQGDSLSPILFTCNFESALRGIRSDLPPDDILPPELQYADDLDFIGTDEQELEYVRDQCARPSQAITSPLIPPN